MLAKPEQGIESQKEFKRASIGGLLDEESSGEKETVLKDQLKSVVEAEKLKIIKQAPAAESEKSVPKE